MHRRNRNTTLIVIVTALILVGCYFIGVLKPVRSAIDQVFNPVGRVLHRGAVDVANGVALISSVGSLNNQNTDLKRQVADLKKQLIDLKEVEHDNEILRAQLNFPQTSQYNLVPANVLGQGADSVRTVLQIDKGSSAGIRVGQAVIANGALVGVIDGVDNFSARVLAVNDPVFKISAVAQTSRASGIVAGELGTGLKMDKISQNDPIKAGETVISAGSGLVPKGLIIGSVESVDRADNAIFQTANLKPAQPVQRLEIVFVIISEKS